MSDRMYTTKGVSSTKQEATYSDVPINLDFHPGTKDIARSLEDEAIRNSLRNILKTNRYERIFNPLFGANLNRLLFEQLDERSIENVELLITTAIENFEPRIQLLDVITTGLTDDNSLSVTLLYTVINRPGQQKLDLVITRVR